VVLFISVQDDVVGEGVEQSDVAVGVVLPGPHIHSLVYPLKVSRRCRLVDEVPVGEPRWRGRPVVDPCADVVVSSLDVGEEGVEAVGEGVAGTEDGEVSVLTEQVGGSSNLSGVPD